MADPLVDLDTSELRSLVALAQHRHFGRAAEELCVSQPALTKRVQRLEQKGRRARSSDVGPGVPEGLAEDDVTRLIDDGWPFDDDDERDEFGHRLRRLGGS